MPKYTDKQLLDALEECGNGVALLHDDSEHWYVAHDGSQSIVFDGPAPFNTAYYIDHDDVPHARKTAREAIEAWLSRED